MEVNKYKNLYVWREVYFFSKFLYLIQFSLIYQIFHIQHKIQDIYGYILQEISMLGKKSPQNYIFFNCSEFLISGRN